MPELTLLVCVRSSLAARTVASCAARLGMASAVQTAVSEAEAMARLAERPAGLVLADTAVTRPDTVGFTQRVLARAPHATVVLFGPESPGVAAAAVAAGARGVLRGADQDLVSIVAKAVLLLLPAGSPAPLAVSAPGAVAAAESYPRGDSEVATTVVPSQRGVVHQRLVTLTERELQVLRAMADGKSNAEIGRELFVSEDTVKTHARRLFRKLGARDRAHAVAAGFRAGLVT